MITDAIIELLLAPLNYLLENFKFPDVYNLIIPEGAFDTLLSVIRPLGYFLPTDIIIVCLMISFSLDSFHIMWSWFLRLKSFISVNIFS